MFYQGLRLFGYDVDTEDGYLGALRAIKHEMAERKPDQATPAGYAPRETFKTAIQKFGIEVRTLGDQLLEAVSEGESVERKAIVAVHRGEYLYALGSAPGPKVAWNAASKLNEGLASHGGRSLSRKLQEALGMDRDSLPPHPVPSTSSKAEQIFAL